MAQEGQTPRQRLRALDARLGEDVGAVRERARLTRLLEEAGEA